VKIAVQGSSASGMVNSESDLDIAVRVTPEQFSELIQKRWQKLPNPGSQNANTREHAIKVGKITARDVRPRLSCLRDAISEELGMKVYLSVIEIGGDFDNGPFVDVR
jgi:hypothetical protein